MTQANQEDAQIAQSCEKVLPRHGYAFPYAALRDTLLPKLLSGDLRAPDAERIVGRCL